MKFQNCSVLGYDVACRHNFPNDAIQSCRREVPAINPAMKPLNCKKVVLKQPCLAQ